jgi:hypothetical protein
VSQETVEIVRGVLEAYRNPELMALLASGELDLGWVDPEIEWDASRLDEMIQDMVERCNGKDVGTQAAQLAKWVTDTLDAFNRVGSPSPD